MRDIMSCESVEKSHTLDINEGTEMFDVERNVLLVGGKRALKG
jgi:hypothetical protein